MENKKYTTEQLEETLQKILSLSFTYLDRAMKDMVDYQGKTDEELTDQHKTAIQAVHAWSSILLDITHRAYPIVYDLFADHKINLDNAFDMYKRFEKANFLKECPCDFCKSKADQAKSLSESTVTDSDISPSDSDDLDSVN